MGIIYTSSYNIYKDNQYVVGTEQKGYIKPSSNSQEQEILQLHIVRAFGFTLESV